MRQDCKYFESRTYPSGDTVRKCHLDLAPEAPWRCPEDCSRYTRRMADVNWSYGSLVTPKVPLEPASVGKDSSVADLLDAAEDIVNAVAPDVLAEVEEDQRRRRGARLGRAGGTAGKKRRRRWGKGGDSVSSGGRKSSGRRFRGGRGGGFGEMLRRRFRDGA